MSLRFTIWLCAIVVGASSLTACQPPRPRIAKVEVPSYADITTNDTAAKTVLAAFDPAERAIQVPDLDGPLSNSELCRSGERNPS